jgi:hypothetical protein
MKNTESASILDLVAGADNRQVTTTTYGAWFIALEPYAFDLALEAAVLCMRDEKINRLIQPKDIIAKIGVVKDRMAADLNRARALEPEPAEHGVTQPVCFEHDLPIMQCDPCIKKTGKLSDATGGTDSPKFHRDWFELIGRVVIKDKVSQNG